jgi:glycerol-3-phosphate dehydrogenase (NAD(P)+)
MSNQRKIAIIGAGAWGTALALVSLRAGNAVSLWARDAETIAAINAGDGNQRYLPGIALDSGILATTDIIEALDGAATVLVATPAQTIREITGALAELVRPGTIIVSCAKGIDRETGELPCEIAGENLPGCPVAALSGPSFATDVARGLPTAVTIGAATIGLAQKLSAQLSSSSFRCYASDDLTGVELGGALKNVMALAVGVVRGLQLGASAEAALFARGFAELVRLATALGAQPQTLTGLSGLGDLVLTCSSPQSRNFAYGMAMAQGPLPAGLPLAEGVFTAGIAADIAREHDIDTPVIDAVTAVLEGRITGAQAVSMLMERPLKPETRPERHKAR